MVRKLLRYLLQYGRIRGIGKVLALFLLLQPALGPASAAPLTIAALGDSLTEGYGLASGEGLVPQLEGWLHLRGHDVRVLNAGVSGDTTAGGAARIAWTLTPEVGALIVALGGNDILRGIDPAVARANLDRILQTAHKSGLPVLLVGLRAPSNYGTGYKAAFDAIYPALARKYDTLLFPDYLAPLTETGDRATVLARYFQADGIHPNAKGVGVIVARFGPAVEALIAQATRN